MNMEYAMFLKVNKPNDSSFSFLYLLFECVSSPLFPHLFYFLLVLPISSITHSVTTQRKLPSYSALMVLSSEDGIFKTDKSLLKNVFGNLAYLYFIYRCFYINSTIPCKNIFK